MRRLNFVPFGTVKRVINAAKVGVGINEPIHVRSASAAHNTAANGAEVRQLLSILFGESDLSRMDP